MFRLRGLATLSLILGPLTGPALAQSEPQRGHHSPVPPAIAAAVGAGWIGPSAPNTYTPSYLLGAPGINDRAVASARIPGGFGVAFPLVAPLPDLRPQVTQPGPGGLMLPSTSANSVRPTPAPTVSVAASTPNPRPRLSRAQELVEIGDRSFRTGNYRRAEERYQQAIRSSGTAPDPHLHLAQVALVRSDYAKAANHLRDAVSYAEAPGWLLQTNDIQAMFGEPGDFARQIARLESYLQTHPQDRNAWFLLGAEQHLSERHRQAHDIFLRLSDRPADPALAAFLDASTIARRAESTHEAVGLAP